MPDSLDGKRVLDIGTYDSFFAFECEKRRAAEVVAIDGNGTITTLCTIDPRLLKTRCSASIEQMS